MGILVDWQIRNRRLLPASDRRRLVLDPFTDYGQCPMDCISYGLSSSGYDIRVGCEFLLFHDTAARKLDPKKFKKEWFTPLHCKEGKSVLVPPRSFVLAETVEYLEMPSDLVADVKAKSRLARCAYVMATTPIEPGWRGKITLEIGNLSALPLVIYAGEGIGQLLFHELSDLPERDYSQKPNPRFQDQRGLTGPEGTSL